MMQEIKIALGPGLLTRLWIDGIEQINVRSFDLSQEAGKPATLVVKSVALGGGQIAGAANVEA